MHLLQTCHLWILTQNIVLSSEICKLFFSKRVFGRETNIRWKICLYSAVHKIRLEYFHFHGIWKFLCSFECTRLAESFWVENATTLTHRIWAHTAVWSEKQKRALTWWGERVPGYVAVIWQTHCPAEIWDWSSAVESFLQFAHWANENSTLLFLPLFCFLIKSLNLCKLFEIFNRK